MLSSIGSSSAPRNDAPKESPIRIDGRETTATLTRHTYDARISWPPTDEDDDDAAFCLLCATACSHSVGTAEGKRQCASNGLKGFLFCATGSYSSSPRGSLYPRGGLRDLRSLVGTRGEIDGVRIM